MIHAVIGKANEHMGNLTEFSYTNSVILTQKTDKQYTKYLCNTLKVCYNLFRSICMNLLRVRSAISQLISKNFDSDVLNALDDGEITSSVATISEDSTLEAISNESGKGSVSVFKSTIKEIDRRKSFFQGRETVFYIFKMEGGEGAPDTKKGTLRRDLETFNLKCSKNALEKFELEVGDVVTFNGKYKKDAKLGVLLQRIVKFTKES